MTKEEFILSAMNDGVEDFIENLFPEIPEIPSPSDSDDTINGYCMASAAFWQHEILRYFSGKPLFKILLKGTQQAAPNVASMMAIIEGLTQTGEEFRFIAPKAGQTYNTPVFQVILQAKKDAGGMTLQLDDEQTIDLYSTDTVYQTTMIIQPGEHTLKAWFDYPAHKEISIGFSLSDYELTFFPAENAHVGLKPVLGVSMPSGLSAEGTCTVTRLTGGTDTQVVTLTQSGNLLSGQLTLSSIASWSADFAITIAGDAFNAIHTFITE